MSALRARLALRRLDRGSRRRVIAALGVTAPAPAPAPTAASADAPTMIRRRGRLLVDLRVIPSSMEQRAARWAKP